MYMVALADSKSANRVAKVLEGRGFHCTWNVDNKFCKPWNLFADRRGERLKRIAEIEAVRGVTGAIKMNNEVVDDYTLPGK